ncbi:E3 ubiquitin-protein ligase TRIM15 isoform X2 [Rhinolophus sinicus]|uniref:E3 ubiquitin-protein ligase TRIM15 isoform X2 n=1 Tax=Rhinolophus sinicus TaxID=89399 RepID=UPI003D796257
MPSTSSHKGAACPACKRALEDAVTAACGHIFCQLCLPPPHHMGAQPSSGVLLCPLCREKEETETLVAPVPLGPLGETFCEEHGEKIYFFCEKDAEFLCVFCREGPTHQAHTVGFLDEAIQPYRDRLRSRLEALSTERDEIEDIKNREEQKFQVLLTQIESKKQQVKAAFERLQQELGEQQCLLLARLTELEKQIWKERDEYILKVTEEVVRLGAQVKELEEKCQQPASELLQDVRVTQSRCEMKTFVSPEAISSDLVRKIRDLHRKILTLPEMMNTFSENLVHHLETDSGLGWGPRVCISNKLPGKVDACDPWITPLVAKPYSTAPLAGQVEELSSSPLMDQKGKLRSREAKPLADCTRGRHSGPSDRQPESGAVGGPEVGEVRAAEAEPARQPPALPAPPGGAGLPRLLLRTPRLAGGGAAGRRRRLQRGGGAGGRGAGGAGPERRPGRLGRGPVAPAVLGQHLPGHRPAAGRRPAQPGRRAGLRGRPRDPAQRRDAGAHLHLHRLLLW